MHVQNIGTNLLYRFERGQYADMRKKYITGQHVTVGEEKSMSQVYGAEHLLRLIGNSKEALNLPWAVTDRIRIGWCFSL